MLFQLNFGCMVHSFKRYRGKRKICLFRYQQLLVVWGNEHNGNQGDGGMDWADWNQGQDHSQLDMLLSQLRFLSWQQHNLPCAFNAAQSRADSPSYRFAFSPQCPSPFPMPTGTYSTRDWVKFLPTVLPMWVSGNCLSEPVTLIKHTLRLYKDNPMLGRPRCHLKNFPSAKSLKIEDFFSQSENFSSVRKRKIKETIQWTIMKSG